ncbi:hypothetical protein [Methylogaea oryzae]|uniref:hypothetical protein n=1 Tax=Methylogaea oryzae TaxID=1295382 RepID=UPI00156ACF71|nr:hypothetical protein [Methylogaea oryzae]
MIFQHQTVAALAEALRLADPRQDEAEGQGGDEPTGADRHPLFPLAELSRQEIDRLSSRHGDLQDLYPLTPMQEGLLFHTLLYPRSAST